MLKNSLLYITLIIAVLLSYNCFSQTQNDTIEKAEEERFYNPLRISGFELSFAVSNYPFSANKLKQGKSIFENVDIDWENTDISLRHESRTDFSAGLFFTHQLFNRESFWHGNLHIDFNLGIGNRINVHSAIDSSFSIENKIYDDEQVTDFNRIYNHSKEVIQKTQDLGLSVAYTLSSPPNNVITGNIGLGAAFFLSFHNVGQKNESITEYINFYDIYEKPHNLHFFDSYDESFDIEPSLFFRIYVPASFSYTLNRRQNIAITSFLASGIEFQKYHNADVYSHFFISLGLGVKYFF